jgi:mannose-6-phosphate isomerase-like protein (cupin superfamily)
VSPAAGVVVQTADITPERAAEGVTVRTLIDTSREEPGLVRRKVDLAPQASFSGETGAVSELWFVIEGTGQLEVTGQPVTALNQDRGVLLPAGATYEVRTGDDGGLWLDAVSVPWAPPDQDRNGSLSRDFADCEIETTGNRQFRVLFGPGRDCAVATQFVGEIPPGRAPDHSHPYDEVVLVLAGEGVAHIGGAQYALAAGTCAHLPPGLLHCLENTGSGMMRVLGVFHPADSPAAKLEERH